VNQNSLVPNTKITCEAKRSQVHLLVLLSLLAGSRHKIRETLTVAVSLPYFSLFINLLAGKVQKNAALTRGTQLAGPKAMQASDIGSNGLVGAACGGAGWDMDPTGATPHWRRRRRRQKYIE
jgi:hypothetical protein